MQARTQMELTANDLELWTLDDAESWNDAEVSPSPDVWMDEDPLLDNDLWMESEGNGQLSVKGLGRLGIRVA